MAQYRIDTNQFLNNGKTIHEVMLLNNRITTSGALTDAFGRLRTSQQFTLFDSQHRYRENEKWNTDTGGDGNTFYDINASVINLNVGNTSGDYVYRETRRVFAYQPGKSLLNMNTFVMNTPETGLRQRVGYFNDDNGVFFENDGDNNYLVLRSSSNGTITDTRVIQSSWNNDKFDGTGEAYSEYNHNTSLDVTKANIFWIDIEWLGVGDVRTGFVVDGIPMPAHTFHHDNVKETTYMTTAILPIRYEIECTDNISSSATMKQICSTVISEGGYELRGISRSIGRALGSPKDIPSSGTFVPIISIRLKDEFKDAIVIPNAVEFFGVTNNTKYRYKIVTGGTLTGAAWASAGANSSVEYDFTATAISGGTDREQGYVNIAAGSGGTVKSLRGNDIFAFQLERDNFAANNNGIILSLVATGAQNGDDALGDIGWEEVTG